MIQYNLYYGDERVKLNIGEGYYDSTTKKVYVEELTPMSAFCRKVMGSYPVGTHLVYYLEKNVVLGKTKYITIDFAARTSLYGNVPASKFFFCFRNGDGSHIQYSYGNSKGLTVDSPDDDTKLAGRGAVFGYIVAVRGYISNEYVIMLLGETPAPYLINTPWGITNPTNNFLKRNVNTQEYLRLSDIFGGIDPAKQFPGDTTDTGGGSGDYELTSTPVEIPPLPTISAANGGMITLYQPTAEQLKKLAAYMWNDEFNWDLLKKFVANPIDIIIGLSIIPHVTDPSGAKEVKVGIIETGVTMYTISEQFYTFDCGEISVPKFYDTALDYAPYTKFSIYLPFIGVRDLNTDEIIGKTLSIKYSIDVLSGQCCAFISVGGTVLYSFAGTCAAEIPITSINYNNIISSSLSLVASAAAAVATGGSSAALGMAIGSTANLVAGMKPNIQRSSGIGGSAGIMGVMTPYLIRHTPKQALPVGYNQYSGYPSNITAKLSDLTGFTVVSDIHISKIKCTDTELNEIEQLLKQGVIL